MLPSDRYLASLLGLTDEQYLYFKAEVERRAKGQPEPAIVAGLDPFTQGLILLAIGIGFQVAASFIKPTITAPKAPGQPRQQTQSTAPITENQRFAPRYGFDSTQDVITLGATVPVVYALRETIGGVTYGGVRVNAFSMWSQMLSLGGGQMLRSVFLLGNGDIASVDPLGFAIGSSTLNGYYFEDSTATEESSRIAVYFRANGGRIAGTDRVAGRLNANDDGSSSSTDVFQVYWNGQNRQDFCSSSTPSSQSVFGVYAPIGNDLMYKVNPVIRPGVRSRVKPKTSDGRVNVQCPVDSQQMNERDKFRADFSNFSGITGTGAAQSLNVGDSVEYVLYQDSDWTTLFDTYTNPPNGEAECKDVASSVAGRQRGWDDKLIIGELYKVGSALAVCTSRTAEPFVSQADVNGATGTSVTATFSVVRAGTVKGYTSAYLTGTKGDDGRRQVATTGGHIMRYSSAIVGTTRACQAVEIGIKSTLGISINGLCNFRDAKTHEYADNAYCEAFENEDGDKIINVLYQSGVINGSVQRYSFFKVSWREINSATWTLSTHAYGVRSETRQALFNYLRVEFGSVKQREFKLEPLTGFEVRSQLYGAGANLYVLDAKKGRLTITENGATVVINGESVALSADTFGINYGRANANLGSSYLYEEKTNGPDPSTFRTYYGLPSVDATSYIDDYGKLAEMFVYDEITSSAESGPEHEVVYLNQIVPNDTVPLYDTLAIIGANIRSSAEWQQFNQFSCYVTGGVKCRRLRNSLTVDATHLFPDVLLDLMTNAEYGTGDLISDQMIDFAAFQAAADWCYTRKYFFDGVQADRVNLRQWAADIAAANLLIFGESDGKFYLRPALQFDAVSIKGLFTAGNIVEGSFKLQYLEPEEREPIQVSVRYREERASTDLSNPGIFPTEREVLVRETTGSETDSIEALDLSDHVTNRNQAIDAAKYIIRMRRIPTHAISFQTTHEGALAKLGPSDYIRVAMDYTQYDEFNNGVVTADGALVSTKALTDGTYDVIAWDGTEGTPPADATLTVSNGGTAATPTGVVFTVKLPSTQVRTYQIERITPDEEGSFSIEAVHMPTNASGILTLADGFDTAGNWVIQG